MNSFIEIQRNDSRLSFPNELNEYITELYFYLHYENQAQISHKSIRLLQLLEKREKIGVGEVADFLNISPNTASENVKRLVKLKHVKKLKDKDDERKVILHLTESGKEIVRTNTRLDEEKLAIIFANMPEEKIYAFLDGFKTLIIECDNLFNDQP